MARNAFNQNIGWRNDEDVALCPSCFGKYHQSRELNKGVEWYPIKKEEGEENTYVCDECEKKL